MKTASIWFGGSTGGYEIPGMTRCAPAHRSVTPQVLEDRLIDFGAEACRAVRRMSRDFVGTQVSRQLVRSATSPAANYAEARVAESRRDFIHKMQICLKELREALVWLRLTERLGGESDAIGQLAGECDQLISIFVKSVKRAKANREG